MKKVMLLGDSIRMSYQAGVQQKLAGAADVWGPAENCRFAKYTLWGVPEWLAQCGTPDVIHWNNGIWDVYHLQPGAAVFTPLDEYRTYLERILADLRKTGARILWASTTPVTSECPCCSNEEIDRYNAEAARLMAREKVAIHDLNGLLRSDLARFLAPDHVHLSEAGIAACADAVAQRIRTWL